MADKLRYKVFTSEDVTVEIDDEELKKYWESHKEEYLTPKRFKLAILWVEPSEEMPAEEEIEAFYKENRTDFVDAIRNRRKPNATIHEGHKSTLLPQYANISYRLGGQKLLVDPKTETFTSSMPPPYQ